MDIKTNKFKCFKQDLRYFEYALERILNSVEKNVHSFKL